MAEKKLINVYVTCDRKVAKQVAIPYDIDEIELKARLRDLGFISSYRDSYLTTKVYLDTANGEVEICVDKYRSLEELGIKENSGIIIVAGEPEPRPAIQNYYASDDVALLYGCPMAKSVREAINQAEKYTESDSIVTEGTIGM